MALTVTHGTTGFLTVRAGTVTYRPPVLNIDGGTANTNYAGLLTIDGGTATSTYTLTIDGGHA